MLMFYMAFIDDDNDKDLFVVLYDRYRIEMIRYASSILSKNTAFAEDVVQDTFIAVAKNIKVIQKIDCSKRKNFLVTIVKHKAIDVLRKQSHVSSVPLDDVEFSVESNTPAPIDVIISEDGYKHLKNCIEHLGDTYREVLELKLVYGFSNAEIASLLGIAEKTAEIRVYRGRQKLKELIKEE